MPDWLVERGIGETRAALFENGDILEARIELEGTIPTGSILEARLTSVGLKGRNAIAVANDCEFLLPGGAPGVSEGANVAIEVTRSSIPGSEPWKRPLARLSDKLPRRAEIFGDMPGSFRLASPLHDEFANAGWDDLVEEARSGVVRFAGGELRLAVTPAITMIDVDGYLEPQELALAGAAAAARAIRRLDIGGSIGIDLPTVESRSARLATARTIDDLLPRPFERTAVNGFGFLQIVRPRRRTSLLELAGDRALFETRALLRRASFGLPGPQTLVAHPAVIRTLEHHSSWLEALSRQLGGLVRLRAEGSLPMSGGYAERT
ncbi:MAG TPA: ribonuclease [Sphingomicrobium sp.]|nr:ribonuclease [Sphingomicrobium sp.]